MENGEAVNLLEDITDVDRRCRRSTLDDLGTLGAKIVRCDFGQQPIAPNRQEFAFVN